MSLSEDARAADMAHMTYGQYMASPNRVKHRPEPRKKPKQKTCIYCGNPLTGRQTKYCSGECYQRDHNVYW